MEMAELPSVRDGQEPGDKVSPNHFWC